MVYVMFVRLLRFVCAIIYTNYNTWKGVKLHVHVSVHGLGRYCYSCMSGFVTTST